MDVLPPELIAACLGWLPNENSLLTARLVCREWRDTIDLLCIRKYGCKAHKIPDDAPPPIQMLEDNNMECTTSSSGSESKIGISTPWITHIRIVRIYHECPELKALLACDHDHEKGDTQYTSNVALGAFIKNTSIHKVAFLSKKKKKKLPPPEQPPSSLEEAVMRRCMSNRELEAVVLVEHGWLPLTHTNVANPLQLATNANMTSLMSAVVAKGADPHGCNAVGDTALHWAARKGNTMAVHWLVASCGVDVNSKNSLGRTPLMRACKDNHTAIAMFLLERGADVTCVTDSQRDVTSWEHRTTALHSAVYRQNAALVAALLKKGADPNVQDGAGHLPLHYLKHRAIDGTSVQGGCPFYEIATMLLEAGTDLSKRESALNNTCATTLVRALASHGDHSLHRHLREPVESLSKGHNKCFALMLDIIKQHDTLVDLNSSCDSANQTIMHTAAAAMTPGSLQMLAELGGNLDQTNLHGNSARMIMDTQRSSSRSTTNRLRSVLFGSS